MSGRRFFFCDLRLFWRVTWLVGYAFLMAWYVVSFRNLGLPEQIFTGFFAVLGSMLIFLGIIIPFSSRKPLAIIESDGLRIFGGFFGGGPEYFLPWNKIIAIRVGKKSPSGFASHAKNNADYLILKLNENPFPKGAGFGNFVYYPETGELCMIAPPVGGFYELALAITQFHPKFDLRDLPRNDWGDFGALLLSLFDILLAGMVLLTAFLWFQGDLAPTVVKILKIFG